MILAAIDLGTITSRLLIAEVSDSGLKELYHEVQITHMGEGLAQTGLISAAAAQRVCEALVSFLLSINKAGVKVAPIAIATSAMRDAANRAEVLAKLAQTGIKVEVISGEREARLSFLGTLSGFAPIAGSVVTVDVGGGSAEVICGKSEPNVQLNFAHSFNVGARRVTELFLQSDPPTAEELEKARAWIHEQVSPTLALLEQKFVPAQLIAVAGSATSAVAIHKQLDPYDSSKVHGSELSALELEAITAKLAKETLAQRQHVIGLEPARAPVIVGGLLCLLEILKSVGLSGLTISETDILQGMLLEHYQGTITS